MNFDERFFPRAPVVAFDVDQAGLRVRMVGLVDTGASTSILRLADLPDPDDYEGFRRIFVLGGQKLLRNFRLDLHLLGSQSAGLLVAAANDQALQEILPTGAPPIAILGRDVLNATRFAFDGPAGTLVQLSG